MPRPKKQADSPKSRQKIYPKLDDNDETDDGSFNSSHLSDQFNGSFNSHDASRGSDLERNKGFDDSRYYSFRDTTKTGFSSESDRASSSPESEITNRARNTEGRTGRMETRSGKKLIDPPESRPPIDKKGRRQNSPPEGHSPVRSPSDTGARVRSPGMDLKARGSTSSSPIYTQDLHGQFGDVQDVQNRASGASPRSTAIPPRPSPAYQPVLHDDDAEPEPVGINIIPFFVAGIIVVVGVMLLKQMTGGSGKAPDIFETSELSTREQMVGRFVESMHDMKESFPGQSKRFWTTLKATTKSVLREEFPKQPAILLLAGTASSMKTINCAEAKLSDIISNAYVAPKPVTRLTIENTLLAIPHSDLKLRIDDDFKDGLGSGSRVAALRNLNKVPGKAAMMFHAYCDNESAPFKDAVIIFTLELNMGNDEIAELEDVDIARMVERQLTEKWDLEIGVDNTMALLSRVANNVAVVRPESEEILTKNNC